MNKKPARKLQLTRDTVRVLSKEEISKVGGGLTDGPTCTLTGGTSPFPSRGPCSLAI